LATPGAAPPALGTIAWTGRFGLAPLQVDGRLKLQRWPLHLLAPYAGTALPVQLVHADTSVDSQVRAAESSAGWKVTTDGALQLTELMVHSPPTPGDGGDPAAGGNELLSWQALSLQGLQVALAPATKPRVDIREVALTDFYSRLVITEQGRFNLQDVAAAPADAASAPASAASAPAVVAAAPASAAPASGGAAATGAGLPIDLELGQTTLRNGRVDFSDRFIRPNYSARLTELNGSIGTIRSGTREMATISLRGRAADTALLDISGQLNPTAQPLALDIRARATDLELAPLSPYAGKYAGYAIERGKLSMDVSYKIDADGKLDAKNQVILNQLTFGEKVDSPSATQLPVLLAVALLKDRNGVIDINLPVSGTLSDPQFSVGAIVWKVIVNLLTKALTAPFALLSGGGADDLSQVQFAPGTTRVTDAGRQALDKVAKALADRPSLMMTVTGAADTVSERDEARRSLLDERISAEARRERQRAAPAAAQPASGASAPALPPPSAAERAAALKRLYQQTPLPDRPRNLINQLKDIPPAEMAQRLLAGITITDDTMRELALQRGLAVRDALIAQGLPSERLFLAAPKLRLSGEGDAAWVPSVNLTLSTR
jgi:pyruvate/2-oxoglutarate dehydrogenase complex dihydrolipoamide acyltransferase (E2) component